MLKEETRGVEVIKTVLLGSEGFFDAAARARGFDISPASCFSGGMRWIGV